MTARVDPDLRAQLEGDPEAPLEAILVAETAIEDLLASLPEEVVVTQRYRLIQGIAVSAPVGIMRRLAALPTVKAIEPVRTVRAY